MAQLCDYTGPRYLRGPVLSFALMKAGVGEHQMRRGCTVDREDPNLTIRHLHVTRKAQAKFDLAPASFGLFGRVLRLEHTEAVSWADTINHARTARLPADQRRVSVGYVLAAVALHELMHALIASVTAPGGVYEGEFEAVVAELPARLGAQSVGQLARRFSETYVAASATHSDQPPGSAISAGLFDDHDPALPEELLLLELARRNPALGSLAELFEAPDLMASAEWQRAIQVIEGRLGGRNRGSATRSGSDAPQPYPHVHQGAGKQRASATTQDPGRGASLLDLLQEPQLRAPHSLADQLALAIDLWQPHLGVRYSHALDKARRASDVLREEYLPPSGHGDYVEVPPQHYELRGDDEAEAFSPDSNWMPGVALVAKSTYVWLAQLSRRFGYDIRTLDAVPDEALAELSQQGFNALWLIGVWWRSDASRTIKRLRGQPDALASAYSVRDYVVAPELGGEDALVKLRDKAARYGLRLASDMVPNHTAIDARWVVEHPDWYVQTPVSPYPAYTFTGPDLSPDSRVSVRIEDHYYDGSDAAVVFQRSDLATGDVRYLYHGNDGTALPWNDTAQLDFLNPETRQAVINTTVAVARRFPLIRLDAAMTLARRHVRRLWHPPPGEGGAVPSRSLLAASAQEFDQRMPQEFWRELVDALATQAPDTMLMAEAFWLMEVYFVRTLGMHRVYNSAFMHMTLKEQNAEYRRYLKQYLAQSPDVLGRFVNYMSNPDEEPAAEQFGDGDKEFGVATLLATLPGLPMFGHGQVEGLREKYGMEFAAPRLQEEPRRWHVERHMSQIAPLLRQRHLFSGSQRFELYDLVQADGSVAEDAYVYSNGAEGVHALVAYNNSYSHVSGMVLTAAPIAVPEGGERRRKLIEALGIDPLAGGHAVFEGSGVSLRVPVAELAAHGLRLELGPYQALVFIGVSQEPAPGERARRQRSAGRGVSTAVLAGRRGVGKRRRIARRRR